MPVNKDAQKRIDVLIKEIGNLSRYHDSLPDGPHRDRVSREISSRNSEVNDLVSAESSDPGVIGKISAVSAATLLVLGIATSTYAFISIGALLIVVYLFLRDA